MTESRCFEKANTVSWELMFIIDKNRVDFDASDQNHENRIKILEIKNNDVESFTNIKIWVQE